LYHIYWPHFQGPAKSLKKRKLEPRSVVLSEDAREHHAIIEKTMIPELDLRLFRVAQNEAGTTLMFVNQGREVMNLSVKCEPGVSASAGPRGLLKTGQTGYVKLEPSPHAEAGRIPIRLGYEDWKGHLLHEEYLYLVEEKTWFRARDAVDLVAH
ncbi:MAG: hypothetical protein ACE5G0_22255, partial [Rhodothermales bacterium]